MPGRRPSIRRALVGHPPASGASRHSVAAPDQRTSPRMSRARHAATDAHEVTTRSPRVTKAQLVTENASLRERVAQLEAAVMQAAAREASANRTLAEALEQQTATAEVLRIISRSTFDLQLVLDTLIENAARLCNAAQGILYRLDGDAYRLGGAYGTSPEFDDYLQRNPIRPGLGTVVGRVALEGRTVHVHDVLNDAAYTWTDAQKIARFRTVLGVPLLRDGVAIGVFSIWKTSVQPFTDREIDVVTTFADQAVIAIENIRLFNELGARNRDLTEALERETATSEVLKAISRSTFELQPVLETLIENATRLSGGDRGQVYKAEGEVLHYGMAYGVEPETKDYLQKRPLRIGPGSMAGRAALERRIVHSPDVLAEPWFHVPDDRLKILDLRTVLAVPMLRGETLLGVFTIWKSKVDPFTDRQIELVTTFADQAVIAIENVRLLQELQAR